MTGLNPIHFPLVVPVKQLKHRIVSWVHHVFTYVHRLLIILHIPLDDSLLFSLTTIQDIIFNPLEQLLPIDIPILINISFVEDCHQLVFLCIGPRINDSLLKLIKSNVVLASLLVELKVG